MKYEEMKKTELLHGTNGQTELDIFKEKAGQDQEASPQVSINTKKALNHGQHALLDGDLIIKNISIDKLIAPDYHPRSSIGDVESLAESIKRDGVLSPPTVIYDPETDQYTPLFGARRIEAHKKLGEKSISCIVKQKIEDSEAAHLAYTENMERSDLNAIDQARHIQKMREDYGYTYQELEVKGYGTTARQSQLVKLLTLAKPVQDFIYAGELPPAHGYEVAKIESPEEQKRMAEQVIKHGYSVKKTKSRIIDIKRKAKTKKGKNRPTPNIPDADIQGVYFKSSENMSEIADGSVHCICSSPPFGANQEFEPGQTPETIFEEIKGVLDEAVRILGPGAVMALNIMDSQDFERGKGNNQHKEWHYSGINYQRYLRPKGLYLSDVIQWKKSPSWHTKVQHVAKETTPHTGYRFLNQVEQILIFRKIGVREDLPSEEIQHSSRLSAEQLRMWTPNVWEINKAPGANQQGHPCVYPEELCDRLIKMFSYEGDTVLDPWLGSGTTVKVARDLNRVGIGYERELKYKPVIMEKLGIKPVEVPVAEKSSKMMEYAEGQLKNTYAEGMSEAELEYQGYNPALPFQPALSADLSAQV